MDMTAGVCDFGRLAGRPELVAWAKRVYDWIGRTHTTRYGWVADVSGGHICEACAIASRIRLGLALYRAGAADPFGEIDRHVRNQLLESQFRDLSFLSPTAPETPRSERATYAGLPRMIRGTFQCWGTANDLIGHNDIEGCGAGGGVQGLALAWGAQFEWRDLGAGKELRLHLLFNRRVRAPSAGGLTAGTPVAVDVSSCLPYEGRVIVRAHQAIARLALRLPEGAEAADAVAFCLKPDERRDRQVALLVEGSYVLVPALAAGERVELRFPLREHETTETAAGTTYRVRWKGSSVVSLAPRGARVPLYAAREKVLREPLRWRPPCYP
jgi:hypothetical protein